MRRHLLGAIALAFLVVGLALWLYSDADFAWVALRIGMVLGALWLALPQVVDVFRKIPRWALLCGVLAISSLALAPRTLLIVIPIIAGFALLKFVGWIFRPPARRRGKGRATVDAKSRAEATVD